MASPPCLVLLAFLGLAAATLPLSGIARIAGPMAAAPFNLVGIPIKEMVKPKGVCYKRLGCFTTDDPWWSVLRPIPAPETPEQIDVRFYLFTRQQPQQTLVPRVPEVDMSNVDFDPSHRTIFITHDFMSNDSAPWMIDMKDALLEKEEANVILTNWAMGAEGPFTKYCQAAANTRVVGAEMARLIRHIIINYKMNPTNIHLIGHGLGAQVSAYCGKKIKNIGRLTALDPSQPAFEGYDQQVRLDASDATFVEVVHTDAKPTIPLLGMGMMTNHGDVDYYINGGYIQPGCLIPEKLPPMNTLLEFLQVPVRVLENYVSCSHRRSTLVYTEAIRQRDCTFWGHPGNIVENVASAFSRGFLRYYLAPSEEDCTEDTCSPLNLENQNFPARGPFVVTTNSGEPFCIKEPKLRGLGKHLHGVVRGVARGTVGVLSGVSDWLGIPTIG